MVNPDGKPIARGIISSSTFQFQKKHGREATFKPAAPTEAYKACMNAYIEAGRSGDYSQCDPRCIYMPQYLAKETDPVGHVLKTILGEHDFQRHTTMLKKNPSSIVIPEIMRQNLHEPLELANDLHIKSQVVDGAPCKTLLEAWKKKAVKYFRPHSLNFLRVRQWLIKQTSAELIQPVKQFDGTVHKIYAFVKQQQQLQRVRVLLFETFPNNEPSTGDAVEFIAKRNLKNLFKTPTSLQHHYKAAKADRENQPQTSGNRKALKQKRMQLEKMQSTAYYEGVRTQVWPGLLEVTRGVRGRAVVATTRFQRGDVLYNLHGDLSNEADTTGYENTDNDNTTFLFHCNDNSHTFVIDSRDESKWAPSPGRLINHSIKHPNLKPELIT